MHNIIDFVNVFPIALRVCIVEGFHDSNLIVSLLGVVLVLRALKFLRNFDKCHLLVAGFISGAEALPVLLYTLSIIIVAFAAAIYYCEPRSNIPSFPVSIYFATITVSTVGYGEYTAVSDFGKMWSGVLAIIGPLYMAMPLGIIGHSFSQIWVDRNRLTALQKMRQGLTNAGYSPWELKRMFELFDCTGDGSLTFEEFKAWLKVMGLTESDKFAQEVFDYFDDDAGGTVDFDELLHGLYPQAYKVVQKNVQAKMVRMASMDLID
jgi:hypothetical protein